MRQGDYLQSPPRYYPRIGQAATLPVPAQQAPIIVQAPAAPAQDRQGPAVVVNEAAQPSFFSSLPNMLLIGTVTGAAFALGSGLVHRFVFGK